MITLIQIALFLAAFFSKQKYITLILAIASLIIPDEIPMIDEVLMLAATLRGFYLDSKARDSGEQQKQISGGTRGDGKGT